MKTAACAMAVALLAGTAVAISAPRAKSLQIEAIAALAF